MLFFRAEKGANHVSLWFLFVFAVVERKHIGPIAHVVLNDYNLQVFPSLLT